MERAAPTAPPRASVTEIETGKVEVSASPRAVIRSTRGSMYMVGPALLTPFGSMAVEDFGAGEEVRWAFWHAEGHYIASGSATVEYTLAPWHDTVQSFEVGPGSYYIIPPGADLHFRVSDEGPLRKLCIIMPLQPEYNEVRPADAERLDDHRRG